jgi:hypothetical protein
MGHRAEAIGAVERVMGNVGLSPEAVAAVHGLLERVDLEALVVDGDTARAKVVDVEAAVMRVVEEKGPVVKGVMERFVKALDADGDGSVSRDELFAARERFGSVSKALNAAEKDAGDGK